MINEDKAQLLAVELYLNFLINLTAATPNGKANWSNSVSLGLFLYYDS